MYRYQNLFFSTTRLLTYDKDKIEVGTGFFFDFQQFGRTDKFLVTNKHIVQNKEKVVAHFLVETKERDKPYKTIKHEILNPNDTFHFHKNYDLAIFPILNLFSEFKENEISIKYSSIRSSTIYDGRSYGIEDVFFIGYPDGLWDSYNYLPLLRKGSTSTLMDVDYGGEKIFLIDAKTIPGSSGSPVFIKNISLEYDTEEEKIEQDTKFTLVGILFGRINQRPIIGTEIVPIPMTKNEDTNKMDINIGSVLKSRVIYDFIYEYLKNSGKISDWFK